MPKHAAGCVREDEHENGECLVNCTVVGCTMGEGCRHLADLQPWEICRCGTHNVYGTEWIEQGDDECMECRGYA